MDKSLAITTIAAAAAVVLAVIISISLYNINDRTLMSKNISEAVAKGMDPLSVRCSYSYPSCEPEGAVQEFVADVVGTEELVTPVGTLQLVVVNVPLVQLE